MKFEIYNDEKQEWRWRLIAENGNIVADSGEGYKNKTDCQTIIAAIKRKAILAKVEDRETKVG